MSLIHTLQTIVSLLTMLYGKPIFHYLPIIVNYKARLLTISLTPISALFSKSSETVAVWPLKAAKCKEVRPFYNSNAEKQCIVVALF